MDFRRRSCHNHESLMHAAKVEQKHHGQTKDDVFLCIPPLYHTGAKMHWFRKPADWWQGSDPEGNQAEIYIRCIVE